MKVARLWTFVTRSCERDSTFVLVRINVSSRTFCMMDNCGNATCVQESVIICLLLRFLYVFPFYLSKVKGNQAFIRNENQRKVQKWYSNHPLLYCRKLKFHLCFELWRTNKTCTFSHTSFNQHTKSREIAFYSFLNFLSQNYRKPKQLNWIIWRVKLLLDVCFKIMFSLLLGKLLPLSFESNYVSKPISQIKT